MLIRLLNEAYQKFATVCLEVMPDDKVICVFVTNIFHILVAHQMFEVLLRLVDQGVIDSTNKYLHNTLHPNKVDSYHAIMHNNGLDGHPFVKPERGHELDGTPFDEPKRFL